MSTRVSVWRRSQRSQPSSQPMSQRRAFTLLEVMIATVILAVGMSAALDAIWNNNNFRRNLDETAMADLVLRQMAARLKTVPLSELGHPYQSIDASGAAVVQGWTMHLRATDWKGATPSAPATNPMLAAVAGSTYGYSTQDAGKNYVASVTKPYPALTQKDLVDAGIIREPVPVQDMSLYVEYYNLNTLVGFDSVVGRGLVPVETGLIKQFNKLQEVASNSETSTATPRQLWYTLVGDPLQKGLSPTDIIADSIIMPPVFSLNNVNAAGVSQQVRDALSHGLVIRILISWRPSEIADANSTARAWSETLIVRRE